MKFQRRVSIRRQTKDSIPATNRQKLTQKLKEKSDENPEDRDLVSFENLQKKNLQTKIFQKNYKKKIYKKMFFQKNLQKI